MSAQSFDVENVYKRDPKITKNDIEKLRDWAHKQPHLPQITEQQLIWFLHSCYYKMEEAKVTIDNYFTIKSKCPEIFDYPSRTQIESTLNVVSYAIFPEKTTEGYAVALAKFTDLRAESYNFVEQINVLTLLLNLYSYENGPVNGFIIVLDAAGWGFKHVTRIGLTAFKNYLFYLQNATPIRLKGLHFVNINPFVDKVVALAKPFLRKELFDLLQFHKDYNSLSENVSKRVLPKDLGGESLPLATYKEQSLKKLLENEEVLKSLDEQKIDDTKRLGKSKYDETIFGLDGNFKKLEID